MIELVVAGIAQCDKQQAAKETDTHARIKHHTDTGNQTEQKTQNRYDREQWRSKIKILCCFTLFVPFAAEVEHAQTDAHPDHYHGKCCNT